MTPAVALVERAVRAASRRAPARRVPVASPVAVQPIVRASSRRAVAIRAGGTFFPVRVAGLALVGDAVVAADQAVGDAHLLGLADVEHLDVPPLHVLVVVAEQIV